jgi:hypothetical protein
MTIPVRKFGVEIEFIGVYPQDAAAAITAAGVPCAVEGYNHTTRNHWKIVNDASIQVNSNMEPGMCGELVSPPLCDEQGLMQLRTVIRALASVGGTVNKSCGLHVHVDANDLNAGQILSVVRRYAHFENQINAFMPPSRRGSRWAHSVGGHYVDDLLRQVNRYGNPRNIFGGLNRYMAVNLASYARHGTVEFRQHSGSTNPAKVANWVTFCLHFVNKAIQAHVLPAATPVVENTTDTSTARARRGRRPNYEARRQLFAALNDRARFPRGCSPDQLAQASGYSRERLGVWGQIMNEIRQFANVVTAGRYRIWADGITNQAMADVWLGHNDSTDPALDARAVHAANRANRNRYNNTPAVTYTVPMVDVSDTLFDGMPLEVTQFYNERISEFS